MDVFQLAKNIEDEVIELRRHFHKYPEVSMKEEKTMQYVTGFLRDLEIPYEIVPDGGIIGTIEGESHGKTIILRADLDALPITESPTNLTQAKKVISQNEGVAHVCGHDAHMAMLLGAAKILNENRNEINGTVLLVFEQGEEVGGGIEQLLKRLVEIGADGVWGIHVKNDLPAGKISVDAGPRMSGVMPFHVKIVGNSGHGSRPDEAQSPIDCFHQFYQQLMAMRLNTLNPHDALTLSVGSINAGKAANVIPDSLEFSGTARFLSAEQGNSAKKEFKRLLEKICEIHHCTYGYIVEPNVKDTMVYNQEQCAEIAQNGVEESVGSEALSNFPAWMASEPFGFCQKYFPGVFAFLGLQNEDKGIGAEHHHPKFDIDESVLKIGVAATVQYAIDFLQSDQEIHFKKEQKSVTKLFE